MSGLGAEVRARVDPRILDLCGVGQFIADQLDDADRADCADLMADSSVKTTHLFAELAERGLILQYNALLRHRKGACGCGRTA